MNDTFEGRQSDYFASDEHKKHLGAGFSRTSEHVQSMTVVDGVLPAVSDVQGTVAALGQFYKSLGLGRQGAKFFRGIADQIDGV